MKASLKCSFLIHLSHIFMRKCVLRPKAVRAPGYPCVPGFGVTLCVGRDLMVCQSSEAILADLPAGDSKQIYHTTYFLSQKGIV